MRQLYTVWLIYCMALAVLIRVLCDFPARWHLVLTLVLTFGLLGCINCPKLSATWFISGPWNSYKQLLATQLVPDGVLRFIVIVAEMWTVFLYLFVYVLQREPHLTPTTNGRGNCMTIGQPCIVYYQKSCKLPTLWVQIIYY